MNVRRLNEISLRGSTQDEKCRFDDSDERRRVVDEDGGCGGEEGAYGTERRNRDELYLYYTMQGTREGGHSTARCKNANAGSNTLMSRDKNTRGNTIRSSQLRRTSGGFVCEHDGDEQDGYETQTGDSEQTKRQ